MKTFSIILSIFLLCTLRFTEASDDWVQKNPSSSPIGRHLHSQAYLGQEKVLLFGGNLFTTNNESDDTWVYNLSENTWVQKLISSPSARSEHSMAYIGDDKVILFGGDAEDAGYKNDTWIYDMSDNTWIEMNPSSQPSERQNHALAYIGMDKVLLFGGSGYKSDTWIYDLSDDTWTEMNPSSAPSGRSYHDLSYIGNGQVLLFGGNLGGNETWFYDLSENTWTQKTNSAPFSRKEHALAYIGSDQVLLFGGRDISPGYKNDTWIYDLSNDSWIEDTNTLQPSSRQAHVLSETSMDGSSYLVLFGGLTDVGRNDETWTFGGGDIPLPVELSSFNAIAGDEFIKLKWTTESELNNLGFIIERSISNESYREIASYITDDRLKGQGNSSDPKIYSFVDNDVQKDLTYWYKLIDVDYSGVYIEHGPISIQLNNYPDQFTLYQNYPNPFNPLTTINFSISEMNQDLIEVNLSIFSITGQKVRTLFDGQISSGDYALSWHGKNDNGIKLPSGIYIYTFTSEKYINSKKMIKVK